MLFDVFNRAKEGIGMFHRAEVKDEVREPHHDLRKPIGEILNAFVLMNLVEVAVVQTEDLLHVCSAFHSRAGKEDDELKNPRLHQVEVISAREKDAPEYLV